MNRWLFIIFGVSLLLLVVDGAVDGFRTDFPLAIVDLDELLHLLGMLPDVMEVCRHLLGAKLLARVDITGFNLFERRIKILQMRQEISERTLIVLLILGRSACTLIQTCSCILNKPLLLGTHVVVKPTRVLDFGAFDFTLRHS